MILALLTSSIAGLAAPADPAPLASASGNGPGLTLVVEETQLSLASRSLEPLLLLVARDAQSPVVATWLPFGAELRTSFARGALEGLRFEVVQHTPEGWNSTGTLAFPVVEDGGAALAWVFQSGFALSAEADEPINSLLAGESLLPKAGRTWARTPAPGAAPDMPATAAPLHVPVPEPSDRPEPGTPPKLEKRPLPPV